MDYQENGAGLLVPSHKIAVAGKYHGQIIRDGKIIDEWEDPNLVTNEGLNALLNIMFNGATQVTTWYLGLYQSSGSPSSSWQASNLANTSTLTECTTYTTGGNATVRPDYVEAASTVQSTTNSASRASFVFTTGQTVYGAFLVSNSTKGTSGYTGTMFSAAAFSASKTVAIGDELLLTYTFTASSV